MADLGLKDVGNVNMTAEQIVAEAEAQAKSNEAMAAINLTRETLHNTTVGNAEDRKKLALAARDIDQSAVADMAKPVVKKESRWKWLTDLLQK